MASPLERLVLYHKAIAHPVRLRLLAMLRSGPLCVCQLTAIVDLAPSTVSEHLSELRKADLISFGKEGRWVEYRLTPGGVAALAPLEETLDEDMEVEADRILLREVRNVSLDDLCGAELDLRRIEGGRLAAAVAKAARLRSGGTGPS